MSKSILGYELGQSQTETAAGTFSYYFGEKQCYQTEITNTFISN